MKRIKRDKFKIKSTELVQVRVHKSLIKLLDEICKIEQTKADLVFGKNKIKIKRSYASKILAGGIIR